jgi:integrase
MASIRVNQKKLMFFDFCYLNVRCREYTTLIDNKMNRRIMEKACRQIEDEIAAGTFSYRKFFPNSKRASLFESSLPPMATPDELVQAVQDVMNTSPPDQRGNITVNPGKNPAFLAFSDQWFTEREVDWKRSTQIKVRDIINKHLAPHFRGRRVGDITKADILVFRADLAKDTSEKHGLSPARVNGILNVLRQILEEAADRFEFTMKFKGIKPLRVPKTKIDPFTLNEAKTIIDAIHDTYRPYLITAFFTAMRTSELLGLTWDRIDFDRKQITVENAWVCDELDSTKTSGSQRTIELSPPVIEALRQQREATKSVGSEFVFCARNGKPFNRSNFASRIWHPLLKQLGLKHRKPYQTRHTAATLWLAAGENPEWIAQQMGHTSTRMLFTVYSRFVPNLTRKDGSAFELLLIQSGAISFQTNQNLSNFTTEVQNHV